MGQCLSALLQDGTCTAVCPRDLERHAKITTPPRWNMAAAVLRPIPAFPPVTIHTCRHKRCVNSRKHYLNHNLPEPDSAFGPVKLELRDLLAFE